MSNDNEILNILRSFGPYIPVLIVMAIGVILALTRWKRHPKISMMAFLGLGGQIILFVVNVTLNLYAGRVLLRSWTSDQISTFYMLKYIITSLIEAGLWLLIILAIFKERGEQPQPAQGGYGRPAASA
ncbi:MAG TPA: hypothetical protein VKA70_20520 [Blastocatellia bacterium]|nr:hypothetical protein [Blastocatellia bacterium]